MSPSSAAAGARPALMSGLANNTHPQWWKDPGLRRLNLLLISCFLGSMANGYDGSLISGLLANPRWFKDLGGLEDVNTLGLVIGAQAFGSILAFLPAPWLSDTFGRRVGIIAGNVGIAGAVLGQTFSSTALHFLGTRLVLGFAIMFNTLSSSTLLMELAHPRQRAVVGALFNTFYFVGSITAAWGAYGALNIPSSWSWRLPVVLQLFWSVVQIVVVLFCPESPRWLVNKEMEDRARAILVKYHANGCEDDELVAFEFAEIRASIETEKQSNKVNWIALSSTPGNRKRLIITVAIGLATQWVGNGIVSYYFAPVLKTVGIHSASQQQGINGGLQIYNWTISIAGALLAERAGRRRLFLVSVSTMLLFMILVTVCSAVYASNGSHAAGYSVIVFLFLFLGGYVVGLTPIPILYVNEIWPTNLRAKGVALFCLTQAVALCFNQYVNPLALESIQWKYYLVYVGVLVGVLSFIWFYVPETKGRSLEEVGSIFDNAQAEALVLSATMVPEKSADVAAIIAVEDRA